MKKINDDVVGTGVKTTISLDLALYEKILQLVYSDVNLKDKFILRLGELHISMAHFRGIGNYISSSGIESIWIESGVYGPATTRSILQCTHYKRTFQAHEDTLIKFYEEFPVAHQKFNDIENDKNNKDNFCLLLTYYSDIEVMLQIFYEKRKDNGLFRFIMNYINMVLSGMEFIYASRT